MSGLTNTQTGAIITGSVPIQYWDAANSVYVDVAAATPLPTTSGGGGGGSSLIQYEKGGGGVTTTVDDQGDYLPVKTYGSTAVTGTFWQATQPVSGTVGLSAGTANIGNVKLQSGTATVGTVKLGAGANSGNSVVGTVKVSSMPTVAVTGTFWQATQPVSGTVTADIGTTGSVKLLSGANSGNNTIGTVKVSGTPNVAVTSLPALAAGTNAIGSVTVSSMPDIDVATLNYRDAGNNPQIAGVVKRFPVSDRPSASESLVLELSHNAPGTPTMLFTNSHTVSWYQVRFAGIERQSQFSQRAFAFGVERANQSGGLPKPIFFGEFRVMPSTFNNSAAPFEPISDDFYLAPGDKLILDSDTAGAFTVMLDLDLIA